MCIPVGAVLYLIIIAIALELETVQFGKALVVVLAFIRPANHGVVFRPTTAASFVRTIVGGGSLGTGHRHKRSKEASEVQEFHLEDRWDRELVAQTGVFAVFNVAQRTARAWLEGHQRKI
jgi:hypothetical protein